ncbi:glycosyltransferase [Nocardioides carbamazepini]|uniref:glycosyltransferase n=1 Tax=Nocardioides carbamazepini TaxID=2854259 RepID=UPI0023520B91|nr:glycosyltransferase [Nocardioides carbamazepini]MCR1782008.1 glycosyltransferase [Nocardioides carbamazepini]
MRPGLRVAVVQQGGVLGGAERWQLHLADATDRLSVTAVGLGAGATTAAWAGRGWPVATVPAGRSVTRLARAAWRLRRVLARTRPDVVLAHGVKAGLVATVAARPGGIPVVWVRHDASYGGALVGLLDRLTQGQVATSSWLLEGRTPRAGTVVNPPRMPEPMPAAEARAVLGIDPAPGELVLGMAARIVRHKGIEDAVRALALPGAAAWELVVAGVTDPAEPDEQDRLVKIAAELGVAERVRFLGEVPDVARVVSAFDALAVLTKPTAAEPWLREAFGMSALEALTGGVPVVAVPPVDDIAAAGGLPVRVERPADVAAALATLADAEVRRRTGRAARRRAQDFPTADVAGERLADFLALLVHRPGAGHRAAAPMSVVTTVLDDEQGLTELLTALVPQLAQDDELVVVDGGSTDGTAEVARRAAEADSRIRLVVRPGAGISRGRNVGIGLARHDTIACTDAGCVPTPGWLAALRAASDRHPDVGLWTGTYRVVADKPWELALAAVGYPSIDELARPGPGVRAYGRLFGRSFDPSMPTGRSVAFTRRAWADAGGFPEHLATGEDVLFGRSIVAAGHRARMVRDAEVAWAQRPTLLANLRMFRRYGEGSGHSLDRRLLGRDLARAASYGVGAVLLARGGRTSRAVVAAGAAAYLSLPAVRAARGPRPLAATVLVPPVAAARDLAKAWGALSAVAAGARGRR